MIYTTDYKTHYICHYCANFITTKKFDLNRHLTKQKRCYPEKCHPENDSKNDNHNDKKISFEDAFILSENKKFYFHKDEIKNMKNFELKKYVDISIEQGVVQENKMILGSKISENTNSDKYQVMKINKDEFHLYFFDENSKKYKCYECSSEFDSKSLIENHILQKIKCDKVSKMNEAIERAKLKDKYNNYEKIESIVKKCTTNNIDLDNLNYIIDKYIFTFIYIYCL
jgi:DNA-directed RNA polymerase subunit RPC12/RpoP